MSLFIERFRELLQQSGKMQKEIERRGGTDAFYRGRMERIKGLND
jgi:hypothetical protein